MLHPASSKPPRAARIAAGLAVALVLVLATASVALPQGSPPATVIVPKPSDCVTPPIAVKTRPSATPAPIISTDAQLTPSPSPTIPPTTHDADPATRQAVTETLTQFLACSNAGDPLRWLALLTPHAQAQIVPGGFSVETMATFQATPVLETEWTLIEGIDTTKITSDGRVLMTARLRSGLDGKTKEATILFVNSNGRYLIDDIVWPGMIETGTPAAAPTGPPPPTPTPEI